MGHKSTRAGARRRKRKGAGPRAQVMARGIMPCAALAALMAMGCVTKGKYTKTKSALDASERAQSEQKNKIAELERKNGELESKSAELSKKLSDLERDTDKLRTDFANQLKTTKAELAELAKRRAEAEKQVQEFQKLTTSFAKMISSGNIKVYMRRGRMIVALPSSVLFPSASARLSRRGKKALADVAAKLKELGAGRRFLVAGHTDNFPIGDKLKEKFKDNWELSAVRALNVTRFLIEQGMEPKSLAAAGYASYDPVKSNRTRKGRRLNRRIEIMLIPKIPKIPALEKLSGGG